jgi:hypothetical protein
MFQTITKFMKFTKFTKLYETQTTAVTTSTIPSNGKYIYFGASVIFCDDKNVCMIYYPDNGVYPSPDIKTVISSS